MSVIVPRLETAAQNLKNNYSDFVMYYFHEYFPLMAAISVMK